MALDITICDEVVEPRSDRQTQYQCDEDDCASAVADLWENGDHSIFLGSGGIGEHRPSLKFLRLVHRLPTEDGRTGV
jgi:hypothetical protein